MSEAAERSERTEIDRKGGPGHTMLIAVLVAVPVIKIWWTVGGSEPTRLILSAMGVANLSEVLIGMVLGSPLLGCLFGIALSRLVFAYFAARGAVPRPGGVTALLRTLALTLVNPVAVGVLAACLYGWGWGLLTGLVGLVLRLGVIVEYRTGRRGRRKGAGYPTAWVARAAALEQSAAALLSMLALPVVAFGVAVNGEAWNRPLTCSVQGTHGVTRDQVLELSRDGTGVVGWSLAEHEVVNGTECAEDASAVVRGPWWDE